MMKSGAITIAMSCNGDADPPAPIVEISPNKKVHMRKRRNDSARNPHDNHPNPHEQANQKE